MSISSISEVIDHLNGKTIVSFDLFDTLIFRSSVKFEDILELSAKYLSGEVLRYTGKCVEWQHVLELRTYVTCLLKKSLQENTEEPTLVDIYQRIGYLLGLEHDILEDVAQAVADYEFSLDCQSLALLDDSETLLGILSRLKQQGNRLIVTSDMYYTLQQVEKILNKLGLLSVFDRVYVSSDIRKTKQTGNLYKFINHDLSVSGTEVLHIGDNFRSDVKMAKKVNWNGIHFNGKAKLTPRFPLDSPLPESLVYQLILSFVYRMAVEVHQRGISKLYFLTRDATVIKVITKKLISESTYLKKLIGHVEIHDLEINRQVSMYLELEQSDGAIEIMEMFLWQRPSGFFADEFFSFIQLECPNQLKNLFLKSKYDINTFVRRMEIEGEEISSAIKVAASNHAKRTFDYLVQKEVVGSKNIAFVDVGYTGTVLRNITSFLIKESKLTEIDTTSISLFLFAESQGLQKNLRNTGVIANRYFSRDGIYSLLKQGEIPRALRGNYGWLECFFKDNHTGPLLGYKDLEGRIEPFFEKRVFNEKQFVLSDLIEHSKIDGELMSVSQVFQDEVKKKFLRMMSKPSKEVVESVSGLSHSVGGKDNIEDTIVHKNMTIRDFSPWRYRKFMRSDTWYVGSLAASGFPLRLVQYIAVLMRIFSHSLSLTIRLYRKFARKVK